MLTAFSSCFACKCCGTLPTNGMDMNLINILNEAKIEAEDINSAYRCPEHNAEVGGSPNSQHIEGTAADVDATNFGVEELAQLFESLNADGVGRYPDENFVHCDTRSGRIGDNFRWTY